MNKLLLSLSLVILPITAFAAEAGRSQGETFILRVIMFVIFAVILYLLLAKRVKNTLFSRVEDIKAMLAEAEKAKAEAEATVKEYEAKMVQLEKELEEMKANAKKVAEAERENMIADAKRQVEQMKQFALNMIEAEKEKAKLELHKEAVELAAMEAEKKLVKEISGDKAAKILDEYVKRIGE